jgi:hypothetical protein
LTKDKSDTLYVSVLLLEIGDETMENLDEIYLEKRSLALASFVYYVVMLAAFVIGLYGFLSLFWLAASAVEHSAQVISSLP